MATHGNQQTPGIHDVVRAPIIDDGLTEDVCQSATDRVNDGLSSTAVPFLGPLAREDVDICIAFYYHEYLVATPTNTKILR